MERMRIKIGGMHCKNCVTLLSDEFGKISGVHHVEISLTKAVGDIYYESEAPSMEALVAVAEKHGYTVRADDRPLSEAEKAAGRKHELRQWLLGFFGAGLVIAIFLLLQSSGIVDAINPGDKLSHAGLAVVIGLVASVSSCFAVVGSLVLAFSELYRGGERESAGGGAIRANALFHAGRLAAFFLLGGALGLVGGSLSVSGRTLSIFTIVYAVVMLFMGLSILSGGKISIGIKLPVPAFARDWFARLKASRHPATPLLLGAITFFLPCGFTQSMQVLALGSGGFMQGGLVMFLFALGTLPVLFLTGLSASWTHRRGFTFLTKSAGILIIVFALFTFFSGTALFDFQGNVFADAASQTSAVATVASNSDPGRESSDQAPDQQGLKPAGTIAPQSTPQSTSPQIPAAQGANVQTQTTQGTLAQPQAAQPVVAQRVEMHVTSRGFSPSVLRLKAGVPVEWVIYGDQVTGCTNRIIVPSLNISQPVTQGRTQTVTFTPTKKGEIRFSCWMGMVRGAFQVE